MINQILSYMQKYRALNSLLCKQGACNVYGFFWFNLPVKVLIQADFPICSFVLNKKENLNVSHIQFRSKPEVFKM